MEGWGHLQHLASGSSGDGGGGSSSSNGCPLDWLVLRGLKVYAYPDRKVPATPSFACIHSDWECVCRVCVCAVCVCVCASLGVWALSSVRTVEAVPVMSVFFLLIRNAVMGLDHTPYATCVLGSEGTVLPHLLVYQSGHGSKLGLTAPSAFSLLS